jgi:serine/threonine-protein kinase
MPDLPLPERLGKYAIVRRLAFGGMAEVLLARLIGPDEFSRHVVIKRVLPQFLEDGEFIAMFRDEARIMAQLYHGNIVQIIELGEADGQYYLVLEHVDGQSLSATQRALLHRSQHWSIGEVAYVIAEVARALDYAHNKRGPDGAPLLLVHRDVTPSNILLSYEGFVKLADFGIARARARISSTRGGAGVLKGKLSYTAPETILREEVEPRSDFFSLGAVAHEMLTGKRLFSSDSEWHTIRRLTTEDMPPPSATNPEVPARLDALVMRMLEKDPARRPSRGLEIAEELAPLAAGTPPAAEQVARTLARMFAPRARTASQPPPRPHVLLVDESRTMRALVRSTIAARYAVIEAATAQEARLLIRGERPAAVICQRSLPGTSGLDLCREIRADAETTSLPVVILSSEVSAELLAEADAAGVSRVLPKKLDARALLDALDALVGGRA